MQAILFVCSYNSVRSPMAAAILQKFSLSSVYVQSAGVDVKDIDGFAIAALREEGIDISNHEAQTLESLNDHSFDKVIALSPAAYEAAKEWAKNDAIDVEYWNIAKPKYLGTREDTLAVFRKIRTQISEHIHSLL